MSIGSNIKQLRTLYGLTQEELANRCDLTKGYISTILSDAIVFGILIIILLVKPTGLLGKKISEKV